jgi:hypothetical protein
LAGDFNVRTAEPTEWQWKFWKCKNFDNVDLIMFQKSNILKNGFMWLQNCSQK